MAFPQQQSNCNIDCLETYGCGQPVLPAQGTVFTPFLEIGFASDGGVYRIGNNSSPPDNRAFIKSFEYGFSNGSGITIEIYDENGSDFSKFMDRINKTISKSTKEYADMAVRFGWIIVDCQGNMKTRMTSDYGNDLHFLLQKIDSVFEGGKIKFILHGGDLQDRFAETRIEKNQGTEDNKKPLKTAIQGLFINDSNLGQSGNNVQVKFLKADGVTEWEFKKSDCNGGDPKLGPIAVWPADQQNALAVIRKWITPYTTADNKGINLQWKPDEKTPTLVLLESAEPAPGENINVCDQNIGTFIVNGGNCSTVLSFTPTIHWTLSPNSGSGAVIGQQDGKQVKMPGAPDKEKVGLQVSGVLPGNSNMIHPPKEAANKMANALVAHDDAVRFREVPQTIEAELKIIGEPAFCFPIGPKGIVAKKVSIIVINPFHITKNNNNNTTDWLVDPPCNNVLSNKGWIVMSVGHQIKEGSYITTLKVSLPAPNSELGQSAPLGANGNKRFENAK